MIFLKTLRWALPPGLLLAMTCFVGCHPAPLIVPSYIQSVGVATFENQTSYVGLDTIFTQAVIRQFQTDGRLPLEDPDKADMKVKMVIKQFLQEPQIFDPKTNFVLQYRLSVVFDLAAIDRRENKSFVEDTDRIHSIFFYTPQYVGAPSETMDEATTQLAEDTAYVVVRRVLEGN